VERRRRLRQREARRDCAPALGAPCTQAALERRRGAAPPRAAAAAAAAAAAQQPAAAAPPSSRAAPPPLRARTRALLLLLALCGLLLGTVSLSAVLDLDGQLGLHGAAGWWRASAAGLRRATGAAVHRLAAAAAAAAGSGEGEAPEGPGAAIARAIDGLLSGAGGGGSGALAYTPAMLARLVQWHEAGEYEQRTGGRLDALAVYEEVRAQAEAWAPSFRPRGGGSGGDGALLQVLVLCSANDYFMRMDRIFFDSLEGFLDNPHVNVTILGPGWAGWEGDHASNATAEYARAYGCEAFDVIFFHQEHYSVDRCAGSTRAVIVQELGDCPGPCIEHFARQADVVSHTYASPLWEMYDLDKRVDLHDKRRLFLHNPHCANTRYMRPAPFAPRQAWAERNRSVTLLGMVQRDWYPLRHELEAQASAGTLRSVHVQPYAGWVFPQTGNPRLPRAYNASEPRVAAVAAQMRRFAGVLGGAAACAFDSQSMRLLLRKYPEAMLTGCPIFATLPWELTALVAPAVFEVRWPFPAGYNLSAHIDSVLLDAPGRALKGAYGMLAARAVLSCHAKADRWLDAVEAFRAGGRGVHFPFERRVGCADYPSFPLPHSWCYHTSGDRQRYIKEVVLPLPGA
jgi:hypothetical protein